MHFCESFMHGNNMCIRSSIPNALLSLSHYPRNACYYYYYVGFFMQRKDVYILLLTNCRGVGIFLYDWIIIKSPTVNHRNFTTMMTVFNASIKSTWLTTFFTGLEQILSCRLPDIIHRTMLHYRDSNN